jgi:hypothetical protein
MSLTVTRDGSSIAIGINSGGTFIGTVVEPINQLRHFWGQLGSELEQAERAQAEQAGGQGAELDDGRGGLPSSDDDDDGPGDETGTEFAEPGQEYGRF